MHLNHAGKTNSFQRNNFDFLRMSAAMLVIVSHQFVLKGMPEPALLPGYSLGSLGVAMFFAISGYLVTQSWCNDPHPWRFLARRILRIWPGLFVVCVLSVFVLGPLITDREISAYWNDPQAFAYFKTLRLSIQYKLPGVFTENPYPDAINGSLWTIPYEVRWYVILMVCGWVGLFRSRLLLIGSVSLLLWAAWWTLPQGDHEGHRWGMELGSYFVLGSSLFVFKPHWESRSLKLGVLLTLLGALLISLGQDFLACLVVIPFTVVAFGCWSAPLLQHAGRWGDPSYGLYIYAFPVQQLIEALSAGRLSYSVALAAGIFLIYGLAYTSWLVVERPFLGLKRYLVR